MFRKLICLMTVVLAGCAQSGPAPRLSSLDPQALSAMQTRYFTAADRGGAMREVISTLQDLGYSIDKVEAAAGAISATKAANLNVTAVVQPAGGSTMGIHADAYVTIGNTSYEVDDPAFYTADFFAPLSRSLPLAPASASTSSPPATPAYAPAEAGPSAPSSEGGWHESPSP